MQELTRFPDGHPGADLPPVCISVRSIDAKGTGVSLYTDVLLNSLRGAGVDAMVLNEGRAGLARHPLVRRAAALVPGARPLRQRGAQLHRRDVFREAQTRFRKHGRILELTAPGPAGIMHWTYPLPMRLAGWRNVYTIHDVLPLHASLKTSVNAAALRALLAKLSGVADRFIAVSQTAQADIVARTTIAADRIACIPQAVEVHGASDEPLPAGLEPQGYFLFAGRAEPRKNLAGLVAAHAMSGSTTPLVLVGPASFATMLGPNGASAGERVICLPYLDRPRLLALIKGARALLFPSLAEGFGLPIAEAMALGVPVMTSACGAMEEVAGGAALLVDPCGVPAMAAAIGRLDKDASLRASLIEAGLRRALAFRPSLYAERLIRCYREVWHG